MRLSKFTIIGVVATASLLLASFVVLSRSGLLGGRRGAVDRPASDRAAGDAVDQGAELVSTESTEGDKRVTDPSGDSGWTRFRGPNGTGVSKDATIPTTWSDTENLQWKWRC